MLLATVSGELRANVFAERGRTDELQSAGALVLDHHHSHALYDSRNLRNGIGQTEIVDDAADADHGFCRVGTDRQTMRITHDRASRITERCKNKVDFNRILEAVRQPARADIDRCFRVEFCAKSFEGIAYLSACMSVPSVFGCRIGMDAVVYGSDVSS